MFVKNKGENGTGKITCLQNNIKYNITGHNRFIECVEETGSDCCYRKRCCCIRIKRNIFYVACCAFSLMLITYIIVISCFVYLNGNVKNKLNEVYNELKVVQEHQAYMQKLLFEYKGAQNQLNWVLENQDDSNNKFNNNNDILPSTRSYESQLRETVGDENEDVIFPSELSSESVNRLNKMETTGGTNKSVRKFLIDPEIESSLNNMDNGDPDLEPEEALCDLLLSFGTLNLDKYSTQCSELEKQSRRTKRSNMRGPVASHFRGGVPETYIQDGGSLVAPWFHDNKSSADFGLQFEFREGRGTVEVAEAGLYMIYAQVYYLTSEVLNSFSINIREKDAEGRPVALCSANAVVPEGGVTEVSCYTAVVKYLNATNQVYLTQRDRNRRMILRDGHSFLGIIRLNSAAEPKKRRQNRN